MVGNDSEGELICWEGELTKACCCVAASRAAVAVCVSLFDFGEVEKKLDNFFTLGEDALRGSSCFSLHVVVVLVVVPVVVVDMGVLAKGFTSLRDIMRVIDGMTCCGLLWSQDRRVTLGMKRGSKFCRSMGGSWKLWSSSGRCGEAKQQELVY